MGHGAGARTVGDSTPAIVNTEALEAECAPAVPEAAMTSTTGRRPLREAARRRGAPASSAEALERDQTRTAADLEPPSRRTAASQPRGYLSQRASPACLHPLHRAPFASSVALSA